MGTDVHGVFQAKLDGNWEDIRSDWEQDRHYFLFAWLANVRNGYGFAGVPTHDAIRPINDGELRGIPADFSMVGNSHVVTTTDALKPWYRKQLELRKMLEEGKELPEGATCYYPPDESLDDESDPFGSVWMGDHSHTWLTAEEILNAERPAGGRHNEGVVGRDTYWQWKNSGSVNPKHWAGGVAGPDVIVVDEADVMTLREDQYTHVRCKWTDEDDGLSYFVDEVKRLKDIYGEVRLVIGFDS